MDKFIFKSGSAFNGTAFQGNYIKSCLPEKEQTYCKSKTYYVSLTEWCSKNFISKKMGRYLLRKNFLIGQRLYGKWWVCANKNCLQELLDYLMVDELLFDAPND